MKPKSFIRRFFSRNYDAIKLGLLVGLLISNIYLLQQQSQTIDKILEISKQVKESNQTTIDYVQCIALIHPDARRPETIQECVKDGVVPQKLDTTEQEKQAPVPTEKRGVQPKQEPTTSVPPEQPKQPGFIERLNTQIEDTLNGVDNVISGLLVR